LDYYRRWISDDVAEFMAWRLAKRSPIARRIVRIMKGLVRSRYREEVALDSSYTMQDAIDDVTTDVLRRIEAGEEVDWALYYMVSP